MDLTEYYNKKLLIGIFSIVAFIILLFLYTSFFTGGEHLTNEYNVDNSLGEITKEGNKLSIEGDEDRLKYIYIIEKNTNRELQKISNDSDARLIGFEPTTVTIVGENNKGEKYVIDTIEFKNNVSDT